MSTGLGVREHANVTREELKHSAAVTVAVLMAVGLVAAWSVLIPGVDAWENIVVAVIGSLKLTGPVAAAFAAWVATRKRQALRGRSVGAWRMLRAPLAIVVVVAGAFAATVLVLAVKTVLTEQAGRMSLPGLAMGMAGLALYAMLGWVTGWLLPRTPTPALAGLASFALFSWLDGSGTWIDRLTPGARQPYDLFQGLSGAAFADQTLWLLGVTATILLGWAAAVTRQRLALAAALAAVLVAGVGVARLLNESGTPGRTQLANACQDWPITVCVHPGMRSGLTELSAAFTKIASRLSGTPAAFTRVEQVPLSDGLKAAAGIVPIHVADLSSGFAEQAVAGYVDGLSTTCANPTTEGYREIVLAWLRGEPLPGGPRPEHQYAAAWFSGISEYQRRGWLRMFFRDFQTCRLSARHFGGGPSAMAGPGPSPDVRQLYPVRSSAATVADISLPGWR